MATATQERPKTQAVPNPYNDPNGYLEYHGWKADPNSVPPNDLRFYDPTKPREDKRRWEQMVELNAARKPIIDPVTGKPKLRYAVDSQTGQIVPDKHGKPQPLMQCVVEPGVWPIRRDAAVAIQMDRDAK